MILVKSLLLPAIRADGGFTGRSSRGIATLWSSKINCKVYPESFSFRMSGSKLVNWECVYPLLNLHGFCDFGNTESLTNYKSHMTELSSICTNESFTDVIIVGNLNGDPSKRRFLTELTILINAHDYFLSDVDKIQPDS